MINDGMPQHVGEMADGVPQHMIAAYRTVAPSACVAALKNLWSTVFMCEVQYSVWLSSEFVLFVSAASFCELCLSFSRMENAVHRKMRKGDTGSAQVV